MRIFYITFRLLFGLLVVGMSQVYGLYVESSLSVHYDQIVDVLAENDESQHNDEVWEQYLYFHHLKHFYPGHEFKTERIKQNSSLLFPYGSSILQDDELEDEILGIFKDQVSRGEILKNHESKINILRILEDEKLKNNQLKSTLISNYMKLLASDNTLDLLEYDESTNEKLKREILKNETLKSEVLRIKILHDIYKMAIQLYGTQTLCDSFKSHLAFCDLKGKMGKQQQWSALLVSGYVRLHLRPEDNRKAHLVPKEMLPLIENYVVFGRYKNTEKQVLQWAVNNKQWALITEWLEEGIDNSALCRDINFLKGDATSLYTYGNNFLNAGLLKWLIHKKKWPVPTDEQMEIIHRYKMRCIKFLKTGDEFLYDLQCVHTLNMYIEVLGENRDTVHKMRDRIIANNPSIFTPLSDLSIAYFKQENRIIKGYNVVHHLEFPKGLIDFLKKSLVEESAPAVEKKVLEWALNNKQWALITEWLEKRIDNSALCKDINFLKGDATSLYTYGNNFLNVGLLKWLINDKKFLVPTNATIRATTEIDHRYKMKCVQFFSRGNELLYDLQCVHIFNRNIHNKKSYYIIHEEYPKNMRDKVIARNPYILAPLSYLSMKYWIYIDYKNPPIAMSNVIHDLLYLPIILMFSFCHYLFMLLVMSFLAFFEHLNPLEFICDVRMCDLLRYIEYNDCKIRQFCEQPQAKARGFQWLTPLSFLTLR